jgi:hypothetical protein
MASDPVFQTYDYVIGGKMVVGRTTMTEDYKLMFLDGDKTAQEKVKSELIHQMAEFILENNLVEFTYYDNPADLSRQVAVRAYLAPSDQVKILRMANKIV